MEMESTSIKDVALRARLSVSTVSRVLNRRGYISKETYDKVYKAIEELDYHPNQLARSLYRKRTDIIGLVIPDVSHPFFAMLTKYIEYRLCSEGFRMMLCNTIERQNRERDYLDMLRQNKVDGIIIGSHLLEVKDYERVNLPIVSIDMVLGDNIPVVSADHRKGGILAAQKLIDGGCTHLLQIIGNMKVNTPSHLRHSTFADYARQRNVDCITYELESHEFDVMRYSEIIDHLLSTYPNIDGVFAVDVIAARVVQCARHRGISIPGRLKVVGYDGTDIASLMSPRLTTVAQPFRELSDTIVTTLEQIIKGEEAIPHIQLLDVSMQEGETTM